MHSETKFSIFLKKFVEVGIAIKHCSTQVCHNTKRDKEQLKGFECITTDFLRETKFHANKTFATLLGSMK